MPGTGYDDAAAHISIRSRRSWRFRLMIWSVLVAGIAVGAGVGWLLR